MNALRRAGGKWQSKTARQAGRLTKPTPRRLNRELCRLTGKCRRLDLKIATLQLRKPKAEGAELSANWGGVLTNRLLVRYHPGEPNIFDFENLSALLVNNSEAFAGKNGPYCWGAAFQTG